MNLQEYLDDAHMKYMSAILESTAEQLDRCHACLGARFGEDIEGNWTWGPVRTMEVRQRETRHEGRVWQQSASGPAASMEPGVLTVRADIGQGTMGLAVWRQDGKVVWKGHLFARDADTNTIAGWIVDQWEALVCRARGVQPLPDNRRCYV